MLSLVEGKRKGWRETGKKSIFSTVMLIIINDNSPLTEASFSGKNETNFHIHGLLTLLLCF